MTHKLNGKTRTMLMASIDVAFTDPSTGARLPSTVVILPPKLAGKRTWEATVHLSERPKPAQRRAS